MRVVNVGHMSMAVSHRRVGMKVAVLPRRHGVVNMVMVAIRMGVGMLMFQGHMIMLVVMGLHQVDENAGQHQSTPQHHAPSTRSISQQDRQGGADEGCITDCP